MTQFITEQCLVLRNECETYIDSLSYVNDLIEEVLEKYPLENRATIITRVHEKLKEVWGIDA